MKHHSLPLLLLLFALLSCSNDVMNLIDNPYVISSAATGSMSRSGFVAFPSIAANESFSKIIVVYREGQSHTSFDGKLMQIESFDKGKSWTNRHAIYTPTSGLDARDPQLLRLTDGTLLCRFFERSSSTSSVVKCMRSSDMGSSYETPVVFPFPDSTMHSAAARGNMAVIDGSIITVCYDINANSWIVRSDDNGLSWHVQSSYVDKQLGAANNSYLKINEASLGYNNNTLSIIARQVSSVNRDIQWAESTDKGATWDWSLLPAKGHAPSLTYYKDNSYITTYRDMSDTTEFAFNLALVKEGSFVKGPISLFATGNSDMGYGDVLLLPDYFIVCCYTPNNEIRCFLIEYGIFEDKTEDQQ